MRVVSLGRAARSKAAIKVRQPLATATAFVHNAEQAQRPAGASRHRCWTSSTSRHSKSSTQRRQFKGRNAVEHPKDLLALLPEGAALAEDDAGYAVGLDTNVTPELADEGLARELVHRIQSLRKAAGFEISDRISVYYGGWDRLRDVLSRHDEYVREETLADEVLEGAIPDGAHAEEQDVQGQKVTLAVKRTG